MSLALKATRAIVARRDLQGLQDQPVLLVQVHQQRRKSRRHHLGLEHRDLVNPRGTASRTEGTLIGGNIHQFRARLLDFLLEAARLNDRATQFLDQGQYADGDPDVASLGRIEPSPKSKAFDPRRVKLQPKLQPKRREAFQAVLAKRLGN